MTSTDMGGVLPFNPRQLPVVVAKKPRRRGNDLISLLVAYASIARRHDRPHCLISLEVFNPAGIQAVELDFNAP